MQNIWYIIKIFDAVLPLTPKTFPKALKSILYFSFMKISNSFFSVANSTEGLDGSFGKVQGVEIAGVKLLLG